MIDDRLRHIKTAETTKTEAKTQVDILKIGKIDLVKSTSLKECIPRVESGRGARAKRFFQRVGAVHSPIVVVPPS
jgi:hypothetical protein